MAKFLYSLGLAAYDHRKSFIAGWLAILTIIGLLAGLFMGKLSNTFSLPGTETERVLTLMSQELPELSGGNGTVVFTTEDGEPFTQEQKDAIAQAVGDLTEMDAVRSALEPFALQQTLDNAAADLAQGKQEIADNEQKLSDGRIQLTDGQSQLEQGAKDLQSGLAELEKNAQTLQDGWDQLEAGKQELSVGEAQLEAARAQLQAGESELAAGKLELADGEQKLNASRTQLEQGEKALAAGKAELAKQRKSFEAQKAQYNAGVSALTSQLGVSNLNQVPAAIDAAENQTNTQLSQAQDAAAQLNTQISQLQSAIADLEAAGDTSSAQYIQATADLATAQATLGQVQAGISQAQAGLKQLEDARTAYDTLASSTELLAQGEQAIADGEQELAANETKLKDGRTQLAQGQKQLDQARAQVAAGERELQQGREQYEAGVVELENGRALIAENEKKLTDGESALEAGRKQLEDGQTALQENQSKLDDARSEISAGEVALADGKNQLALGERTAALSAKTRFVSEAGNTAIAQVTFYGQAESLTTEQRDEIKAVSDGPAQVGVTTLFSKEIMSDLNSVFGAAEMIGFIIAGVVLLVMLGTLIAAGLPLLMALLGVGAGVGGTLALSSLIDMQSITPALALMLGLAVGIDYSLFIVHRHRTQLASGMPMRESIGRAIGTSGNAVVFAGLTVIIALAALVVPGLPFLAILGVSAAFTVLMSVLLSITLTPALLGVIGEKILPRKARDKRAELIASGADAAPVTEAAHAHVSASSWWVGTVTKLPWLAALASVAVLAVIALPTQSLATALPDGGSEPLGSDAQRAYELTSSEFGEGYNGQLILLTKLPAIGTESGAEELQISVAEEVAKVEGVEVALPVMVNESSTYGAIQIIPTTGPASPDTEATVHRIRDALDTIEQNTGVEASVTGQVAAQIDVSEKITAALPPYLAIVVGLSLVLLLLVFRSVVVPVVATVGFLLSLAASFGATVAVYQWGWFGSIFSVHNPAPILSFLPILLTGILFGLAMDYQVFLVTAMREAYAHGGDARKAVRSGFNLAAPVVVAAALIMISVFAGFIFSHLSMIRPLGFALAIGVLFDAFVVRMTLTPAVMHLLGEKAWYIPKWLDRILPDVDVEGASLGQITAKDQEPENDFDLVDPAVR